MQPRVVPVFQQVNNENERPVEMALIAVKHICYLNLRAVTVVRVRVVSVRAVPSSDQSRRRRRVGVGSTHSAPSSSVCFMIDYTLGGLAALRDYMLRPN